MKCERCGKDVKFIDAIKENIKYALTKRSLKNYSKFWCYECKMRF